MWNILKQLFSETKDALDTYGADCVKQMNEFEQAQQDRLGKLSDNELDELLGLN